MPSRCTLGVGAGSLLDRPQGPVLPKYSCNVIRKRNKKFYLMCPIGWVMSLYYLRFNGAADDFHPDFIGLMLIYGGG